MKLNVILNKGEPVEEKALSDLQFSTVEDGQILRPVLSNQNVIFFHEWDILGGLNPEPINKIGYLIADDTLMIDGSDHGITGVHTI